MNTKDNSLDQLLNKLGGAIEGKDLSPDAPAEPSTSGRTGPAMPPARPRATLKAPSAAAARRQAPSADDQPGRLPSYVLKEILEGRTAAAQEGRELELTPYVSTYGADRSKLLTLMEFNCLPVVGKVATFGHQYAFARAPAWWVRGGLSGAKYVSEPVIAPPPSSSSSSSASGSGAGGGPAAASEGAGAAAEAAGSSGLGAASRAAGAGLARSRRAPAPVDSGSGVGDKADEELMRQLLGNPVAPAGQEGGGPSGPSAMFGSGGGAGRAAKGK
ncbi:hypothetical protein HYH02_012052 [Chlamydomonas schloesseri]|uniref:Uncharacterized protein n=1 Tax=Chlamydomonas schloesseri TaxID=2026947 RepID=A0A835W0T7_9CHLO|nr:hypothetical protein HYH02_012052 [Chlamydomonas schloesseri]|eukprot:KAG2435055.1 hypothetical protein HYH02_012052 [Chlamydomonas schloesseri]